MARRRALPADLEPYNGCDDNQILHLTPLAVGWLSRAHSFTTGVVPTDVIVRLLQFCLDPYLVCRTPVARPCQLDHACGLVPAVTLPDGEARFGDGEIRVIGADDVFAAPSLIHHYVTVHHYLPPAEFVKALRRGPAPGSPEHRAYLRALG